MIRTGMRADLDAVQKLYEQVFSSEEQGEMQCGWKRGVYPTRRVPAVAVMQGTFYICEDGGRIVGSMILNHIEPDEYKNIAWARKVQGNETVVAHVFCVSPEAHIETVAEEMLRFAVKKAKEQECLVVRTNVFADHSKLAGALTRMGFARVGEGTMKFHAQHLSRQAMFEYVLE